MRGERSDWISPYQPAVDDRFGEVVLHRNNAVSALIGLSQQILLHAHPAALSAKRTLDTISRLHSWRTAGLTAIKATARPENLGGLAD